MPNHTRILVADDDSLLQALLQHRLTAAGYEVMQVGNGGAVLERLGLFRPDLIVLDAMMPVMDGFEALRRMKSDPKMADIPVVMLTAMRRDADVVSALRLGAADYLAKPFNPDELIARLVRLAPPTRKRA